MTTRRYGQFCGLAVALDAIGERWTLLVIREMLRGPVRFGDLLIKLDGIGPNTLTARLKRLEELGLALQKPVASDGRGREYVLTPAGEGLRGAVLQLAGWGLRLVTEEDATGSAWPEWAALAIEAMSFGRTLPRDVSESYEFQVSGETFWLLVDEGVPAVTSVRPVHGTPPALTIETETETFIRIGARLLSPLSALASGQVRVRGDVAAFERCSLLLGLEDGRPGTAGPLAQDVPAAAR